MKLDATDLRYLSTEEFRVLTAVEMGSKNHEVVPTPLIAQISKLRSGGINKVLGSLAKRGLISRVQNAKYDGYRLTYGGYDYLAIRTLSKRDTVTAVGNQIGVGKESDIYVVSDAEGDERVLKLHRLGRISFRAIKSKRDYLGKRKSASWMYMSRLAAQKEYAFMKILHENGFPVPKPLDHVRHCVLMELIDAYPLRQISSHPSPGTLYSTLMDLIVRFAHSGLIHGDFNEFNILIRRDTGEPVVIDFPQMVSTRHANAEWYFNRDVECIRTFFRRRFRYESKLWPKFTSTLKDGEKGESEGFRLDVMVAASGFGGKEQEELQKFMEENNEEEQEDKEETDDDGDLKEENDSENESQGGLEPEEQTTFEETTSQSITELDINPPDSDEEKSDSKGGETSNLDALEDGTAPPRLSKRHRDSPIIKDPTAVKQTVTAELANQRTKQEKRYHSKKGVGRGGRSVGSKRKIDKKIRIGGDGWD